MEAARAGEAGAGFAVVADEVRNLAMRAAEAARNTASLIEGSVVKIHGGCDLVDHTNAAFGKVADNARRVGELVAEIAAASREQADGIGQVNRAVGEMDKVTQQNAAGADESAGMAAEMNSQAEILKEMVENIQLMVKGRGNAGVSEEQPTSAPRRQVPEKRRAGAMTLRPALTLAITKAGGESPEKAVQLDHDGFQDM